jgi:hypothetical protein
MGFTFHYFCLASFMWMLIMAIVQYLHFVRIFNTHVSYFFWKTSLISWLIPLIFPSIVMSSGSYLAENRCWIDRPILLYTTFLLPMALVMLANLVLFGLVLQSIYRHNDAMVAYQKRHSKIQTGAALCCFVSIGQCVARRNVSLF